MKKVALCFFVIISFLSSSQNIKNSCYEPIIKGVELLNKKEHTHSLELLFNAEQIAESNQLYECLFLAKNNIGVNYHQLLDYGKALNYYLEAYTIAIKYLDASKEMIVLNNIAILYTEDENLDKAEEYLLKAYKIANTENDSIKIGLYASNLGELYNEKKNWQVAKEYFEKGLPLIKDHEDLYDLSSLSYARNLIHFKQYQNAIEIIEPLLPDSVQTKKSTSGIRSLFLQSIVYDRYYKDQKKAINAAKNAVKGHNEYNLKFKIFNHLSDLYTRTGAYKNALQAKDSVLSNSIKMNRIKADKLFEKNKVKFEIERFQNELLNEKTRNQNQKRLLLIVLSAFIVITVLFFWAIKSNTIKRKQQKVIYERNKDITNLQLEKKEKDNLLLKNTIEKKNRELASKALNLSTHNNLINSIIKKFEKNHKLKELPEIANQIKELKELLRTEKEWDNFVKHFEDVNQNFLTNLKLNFPDLNKNDIRFISYAYMNLHPKELARILNITPEAFRKRKERIVNKLNITENIDLFDFLIAFNKNVT